MKYFVYFFIIFIAIILLVFFYSLSRQAVRKLASPLPTVAPIPTEIAANPTPTPYSLKLNGKNYEFYFHKITANETLDLIPNFEEATFSAQIVKKYACDFGINGGFYTTDKKPLGLFYLDPKYYGREIESKTFNGFFSIFFAQSRLNISSNFSLPINQYEFIVQSGPVFFFKSDYVPVYVDHDFSRRHLVAKSTFGEFYLFSIFEKDNAFNGPRLEDIKPIFNSPELKKIADFEEALNLDGGSASAFYDGKVQVAEFKPVGSFLCGRSKL